jgi:hypothetical protein
MRDLSEMRVENRIIMEAKELEPSFQSRKQRSQVVLSDYQVLRLHVPRREFAELLI